MKITIEGTPKEVKELLQATEGAKEQNIKLDSITYSDLSCSTFPKETPQVVGDNKERMGVSLQIGGTEFRKFVIPYS
ncbi:hypothetical protein [Enterococcus lactis]|uniref:hypothetical protein n=1 Tax=Enterococcus lactis TaxID=357441 RepID=UPI002412B7E7|nr:hypothetical protein [Enterococcus lactis]